MRAPRLPWRGLQRCVRGGRLAFALVAGLAGGGLQAQVSVETRSGDAVARFEAPTDRYGHAIMGDLPEWGRLCLEVEQGAACVTLPKDRVFEDLAPRLADLDGDGQPEAIVVEASFAAGAALSVYRLRGGSLERIATPHIGTRNRWLAPAAIGDLDGDGHIEIAYVDRPHLAKTLRVWRFREDRLTQVASLRGLSNHRIGEPFITGGLRDCGAGPEIITADAGWRNVMATQLRADILTTRPLGPFGPGAVEEALNCKF